MKRMLACLTPLLVLFLLPIICLAGDEAVLTPFETPVAHQPGYTRMADNFFVFYDPSTAMVVPYKNTGLTRLEVEKEILQKSNASLPELGWQTGLYPHWKNVMWLPSAQETFHPYYRLQNYDRKKYSTAVDQLPVISSGPPMLQIALMKMEYLLGLPGRTEIFLFTNGEDSRVKGVNEPAPLAQAKMLAAQYDVCFTIISSATTPEAAQLLNDVASVNGCSQVIDFDTVAEHPEHLFGKLYSGSGDSFGNILFDFDRSNIRMEYRGILDKLGKFLADNPQSHAVLSGFTDSKGSEAYNIRLSERRTESVRAYLDQKFNINSDRILLYWYGYKDPVASNNTSEGRQLNRRVTITLRQ